MISCEVEKLDLEKKLKKGIVIIDDFLPQHVANAALRIVEEIPEAQWNVTEKDKDYRNNNIEHRFVRYIFHSSAFIDFPSKW